MKLPNSKNAYIPKDKLTNYLLSKTHKVGRFKAKYFHTIGFDETSARELEQSLLKVAKSGDVKETTESLYGTKYVVDGFIKTPIGDKVNLETVWIIETNQNRPRFVTAYPV